MRTKLWIDVHHGACSDTSVIIDASLDQLFFNVKKYLTIWFMLQTILHQLL